MQKNYQLIKQKIVGGYHLIIALVQLATGYVLITDGRMELMVLGGILVFASVISLSDKFINNN